MSTRSRTPEPPYCWQNKEVLRRIESAHGDRTDKAHALAVYVALTWFASDIGDELFTIERSRIAERAGVSYRKAADVLKLLESLGVIGIKANMIQGSKEQGPCTYTLGTPCPRLGMDENFAPCREEEEEHKKNREEHKNNGAKLRFDARAVSLPFSSPEFRTVWEDWCKHRKEKRNTLTQTATSRQLDHLRTLGEAAAIAAINRSIANSWQGLVFEAKAPSTRHPEVRHDVSQHKTPPRKVS